MLNSPFFQASFLSKRGDNLFLRMEIRHPCYTDREDKAHKLSNLAKRKVLMITFLKSPVVLLLHPLSLSSPNQPFLPTRNEWSFYVSLHFYPVFGWYRTVDKDRFFLSWWLFMERRAFCHGLLDRWFKVPSHNFWKTKENKNEDVWVYFTYSQLFARVIESNQYTWAEIFKSALFFSFSVLMMTCTSYHNDYLKSLFGFEEVVSALGVLSLWRNIIQRSLLP